MKLEDLVGVTVSAVYVNNDDQSDARLVTDAGDIWLECDGDCCSETWFSDITNVSALIGHPITAVEELEMPDAPDDGRGRQDSDELYGFTLSTTDGLARFEFRNSSNGYYGGSIEVVRKGDKYPWGNLKEVPKTEDRQVRIEDEYHAPGSAGADYEVQP